jgi:hypothetical protein
MRPRNCGCGDILRDDGSPWLAIPDRRRSRLREKRAQHRHQARAAVLGAIVAPARCAPAAGDRVVAVAVQKSPRRDAMLVLGLGLGLIVLAGAMAKGCHDEYAGADVAEGTVVRLNHGPYHAEVEYTNADGETRSFPDNTVFGREVGERVPVRYFAHDGPHPMTADFNGMYGLPVVLAGIGLLGTLGGGAYLAWLRRRDAKPSARSRA